MLFVRKKADVTRVGDRLAIIARELINIWSCGNRMNFPYLYV